MLAMIVLPPPRQRAVREALGLAGLLGILLPVAVYTPDTPFPGLAALPPVLGATILIWIGREGGGSIVGRLLSHRALVGIGLVSYSLYLWHWPILAYLRVVNGSILLPVTWAALAVLASLVMAWLSYRFVERPFRAAPPHGLGRGPVFAFSAAAIAVLGIFGEWLHDTDGVPQRLSRETARIANVAQDRNPRMKDCMGRLPESGLCSVGAASEVGNGANFLLWGDSHADMLMPGIALAAGSARRRGLAATHIGCPPLIGVQSTVNGLPCTQFKTAVWSWLDQRKDIDLVIIGARWAFFVEGTRFGGESGAGVELRWLGNVADRPPSVDNAELVEAALTDVVDRLVASGRQVVLIGPVPEVGRPLPLDTARRALMGLEMPAALPAAIFKARGGRSEAILMRIAGRSPQVRYLPMSDLFCDAEQCSAHAQDGTPLYYDDDHLTRTAAETLLLPRLGEIWDPPGD